MDLHIEAEEGEYEQSSFPYNQPGYMQKTKLMMFYNTKFSDNQPQINMNPTGNMLGVVGVTVSMKSLPKTERMKIAQAAYRKLQSECREIASEEDDNATSREDNDISSYLGVADGNHYMKPCNVNIKDSMVNVLISEFSVLRMPLQSLALAMLVSSNPCRMVCLGKTNLCSFQLGKDSERVALFIQLASAEKANQLRDVIEGQTPAVSLSPTASSSHMEFYTKPIPPYMGPKTVQPLIKEASLKQHPAPTVKPPQLPPRQAHTPSEPFRINQPARHQLPTPPFNTSWKIQPINAENTELDGIKPEQLPIPALLRNQQHSHKLKDTARSKPFPHFVMDEIRMKVSQNEYGAEPSNARLNRQMSEPKKSLPFAHIPPIASQRHSLQPVAVEFQTVSTPTSHIASSEPVSRSLGNDIPKTVAIQVSHTQDKSPFSIEQNPYKPVISKSSDSGTQDKGKNLVGLYDKDGYLIMHGHNTLPKEKAKSPSCIENSPEVSPLSQDIPKRIPLTQENSKPPPPKSNILTRQNIPKPPRNVTDTLNGCEYESLPPPPPPHDAETRKRQSKIIIDLCEEEIKYINELKELQNSLTVPGISRDLLRVVQELYEFHRLTFCPLLEKACIGSKRDLAKSFTENFSNFKIYEEMLVVRSKHMDNANVSNFRDKFLLPLIQLQKYNIALSALQDRDHDDRGLIEEAKDVIHNTLLRADNFLLLDSIAGFPFTKDQCSSIVNKGVMKIKSKGLSSKKDYLVILTEAHLIFAEKVLPNKNQYIGCLRMDNLSYEGHNQSSLSLKGILHPGNGKVAQFTFIAQNTESVMNWVKAIKEKLVKRALNPRGFHQRSTLV